MVSQRSNGILDQYQRAIALIQRLSDGVMVVAFLVLICWYFNIDIEQHYQDLAIAALLLTLLVFRTFRLYRPWRGSNLLYLTQQIFSAWIVVAAILAFLGYITKTSSFYSRKAILTWIMLTPVGLLGIRMVVFHYLRWHRSRGLNSRTVVIGGAGCLGTQVAQNILDPWLGMRLLGFFDDFTAGQKVKLESAGKEYQVLGDLDKMVEFIQEHNVDLVYLALPMRAEDRLREVIESLKDTTASVYFAPDVFTFHLLQASLSDLQGIPLISLWETPFLGVNGWVKRVTDIVLASLFLLVGLPIMVFCAAGVKLSSPGPIIFKQRRYGLDGKEIRVFKFRTMTVCLDGPDVPLSVRDDNRLTFFGAFLRRHSLDELPQLFNILLGTMSIVGPRPHAVAHNEFYRNLIPGYMLRHKVRPGLTGLAQVRGCRGEAESLERMGKRVEFDLEYLKRWSIWLDLKIIYKTVFLVFKDEQAL